MSPPFAGGVALVEMPGRLDLRHRGHRARGSARNIPTAPSMTRTCPRARGSGSDICPLGSYPRSTFTRRRNPLPAAAAAVSISERQRHLRRHHRAVRSALRAADHAARAGLRHPRQVRPRELHRRRDAEHDRRGERQAALNSSTGRFISITDSAGERVGRQPRDDERQAPPGDQHAQRRRRPARSPAIRSTTAARSGPARRRAPRGPPTHAAGARRATSSRIERSRSRSAAARPPRRTAGTASAPAAGRTAR